MSSVVHPVGKQPPRVYWVRRILVVLLALVVLAAVGALIGLVVRFIGGLGGDSAKLGASSPTTTSTTGGGPAACGPTDLQLSLTATAQTYPAGSNPEFALSVVNGGSVSCTFDASAANRELVITSGSDRIWSSVDCAADTAEDLLLLAAGATSPTTVTWDRQRSAAGCPSGLAVPRPGTYKATATVAGVTVAPVVFALG